MWHPTVALPVYPLVAVLFPLIASAEFSGSVTGTTDYIWRGYSKSTGHPAIRANLDYEHSSGVYLGTWVSTVNFGDQGFKDRSNVEIAPYLGWTFSLSDDWRLDTQWTRYLYDGKIFGGESDYNEFYGLLHFRDMFSARIGFSENFYNRSKPAADLELTGRYPVTDWLEFSTGVGFSLARNTLEYDYLYWNAGFTGYYKFVGLDLRYTQSRQFNEQPEVDNNPFEYEPEVLGPTILFSISVGF